MKTAKERREALRKRTEQAAKNRDKTGLGKSMVLDVSGIEDLNLYKPTSGKEKNCIDIIPFIITQDWYVDLRTKPGQPTGLELGFEDYKLEIPVHRNVGINNEQFLCLRLAFGKNCPMCEALREEYDKPDSEQSDDIIRDLTPSWRCYYNVYDYNEPDKDIQLWADASYHLFEKNFLEEATEGEEYVTFSDLQEGKTIEFKGKEKSLGKNTFVEAQSIQFIDREIYKEDIFDDVFSLDEMLIIPTYEEVSKAFLGLDEEAEVEEGIEQSRRQNRRGRQVSRDESEDEVSEEEVAKNQCPGNGTFGQDCNELSECQECPEETFQACAEAQEQGKEKKEPEKSTVRRARGKKEEIKEPVSRRRGRRVK